MGWTNGENAHEVATTRDRQSFEAVAAALKLEELPPASEISGPAEPPVLVPAPGERPVEGAAVEVAPVVPEPPRAKAEGPATTPGAPYRAAGE